MDPHRRADARGFTLIEALVAMALLGVAGGALFDLSIGAVRAVRAGRDRTLSVLASAAVLATLDDARAPLAGPACLSSDAAACHDGVDEAGEPVAVAGGGVYRRRWMVGDLTAAGTPGRVVVACAGPLPDMRPAGARRPPGTCLAGVVVEVTP
jgi:prepilin-type N-terminal cleavage/methylation domain-containing protein